VADAIAGAWRTETTPADLSPRQLATVAPLLISSGAAALASRKLNNSQLSNLPAARDLKEASRLQLLHSAVHERDLQRAFKLLDENGVDAILIKGWAASRLYPEPGMRPPGDIDLFVRSAHRAEAERALASTGLWVDLHGGNGEEFGLEFDEVFERSELIHLDGAKVRVPSREDHLRIVCLHMLRHGAWRPLWLCDVAAAVENSAEEIEWARVLGFERRSAEWVLSAIELASELLGARVENVPGKRTRVPRWLVAAVVRQWATPFAIQQAPQKYQAPMRKYLRDPRGFFRDLAKRWPDPITATIRTRGPFNQLPRWPFQVGDFIIRGASFVFHLPDDRPNGSSADG
jgi:hypothetical protein